MNFFTKTFEGESDLNDEQLSETLWQVRSNSSILNDLAGAWDGAGHVLLWWDQDKNVLAGDESRATYQALFGTGPVRWSREVLEVIRRIRRGESVRRRIGPISLSTKLPTDIVLIEANGGPVAISSNSGKVIKIGRAGPKSRVQREVEAWTMAKVAGIADRMAPVLEYGTAENGKQWMISKLVPNTRPLPARFKRIWRRWLKGEILPVLQRFYEASNIDICDADEIFELEKERLRLRSAPEQLWNIVRLIKAARPINGSSQLVVASINGDLKPEHVHRSRDGWRLIDWGLMRRQAVFYEFFFRHFRLPMVQRQDYQAFWAWLRGEVEFYQMPNHEKALVELFLHWQASWIGIAATREDLRYQMLVMVLRDINEAIMPDDDAFVLHGSDSSDGVWSRAETNKLVLALQM